MSDKPKDSDQYEYEINEWKRKLNMMSEQVKVYEAKVGTVQAENDVLIAKLADAAQDNTNIRVIMTNNITDSNARQQQLLAENQTLKQKLRELS